MSSPAPPPDTWHPTYAARRGQGRGRGAPASCEVKGQRRTSPRFALRGRELVPKLVPIWLLSSQQRRCPEQVGGEVRGHRAASTFGSSCVWVCAPAGACVRVSACAHEGRVHVRVCTCAVGSPRFRFWGVGSDTPRGNCPGRLNRYGDSSEEAANRRGRSGRGVGGAFPAGVGSGETRPPGSPLGETDRH